MRIRYIQAVLLTAFLLLPAFASAQDTGLAVLDSRDYTRFFDGMEIATTISLRAAGNFTQGHRAYLQLDIDSTITSAQGAGMPRATVINGYVVIALPPGLEPDGQPRLQFYDHTRGRYEYMYSKAYPRLSRFAELGPAMDGAASNDPGRILSGITEITGVLDPAVAVTGPMDPRLTGGDPQYALVGVSWLIPCNVMFNELVGLFDPANGIAAATRLRVSVPLKVGAGLRDPRVVLFVGGLSAAVDQVELLPGEIPPTALPLVPVPTAAGDDAQDDVASSEPAEPAAGEQDNAAGAVQQDEQQSSPRRDSNRWQHIGADGQDEEPDIVSPPPPGVIDDDVEPVEDAAAPPPPPQPIPVLVYSYDWLAWETELDLSSVIFPEPGTPAAPEPAPVYELAPMPPATASDSFDEQVAEITPATGSIAPPQPERPVRDDTTVSVTPAPELETAAPTASVDVDEPAVEITQDAGVTQVQPGTLPEVPQTYTVPLKPITGTEPAAGSMRPLRDSAPSLGASAADGATGAGSLPATISSAASGGMAAGAYTPPVDLGEMVLIPEGYFLMGTSTSASAGDADELPQTQVYLPSYYIDKYPVTNRQFHNFVISAGFKPRGNWDKYYTQGSADLPVRGVNWEDASAYAAWAGKRLPTEAEWEKAARGEAGATYPWGEDWSAEILPRGDDLYAIMTATSAASPYGVMGMVGLVWQWTASAHHDYPYNPDARGSKRVLRGGAYSNGRNIVRCANRYAEPPNVALNTFSFRCAKDAP